MTTVKVQRPLATNDSDVPWLFKSCDHSGLYWTIPEAQVPIEVKRIMGSQNKCYIECDLTMTGEMYNIQEGMEL